EPVLPEHAQLLGDRRLGDPELGADGRGDGAGGLLAVGQQLQDAAPDRVAQDIERVHATTMSVTAYISQVLYSPSALAAVAGQGAEGGQAVDDRAAEVDRAGLGEVAGGHGDLGDAEPGPHDLADQLLVEDEVVGGGPGVDRLQQLARVRPEAGVVLGQAQVVGPVLEGGEEPFGQVLPAGHAPGRSLGQGGVVAGLLVAAVAQVLPVDDHLEVQQLGHGHGVVAGEVVDQDDVVDHARRDVAVG